MASRPKDCEKGQPVNVKDISTSPFITTAFLENRERLRRLAVRRMQPRVANILSTDDVLQEVFIAAQKRRFFFESRADVPIYFKFRLVLLQVITECERRHLGAQKRDVEKELRLDGATPDELSAHVDALTVDAPSPATQLAVEERHELLRHVIGELAPNDREILTLRHFDGLSNQECASVLSIDPKAASIRYARALSRLRMRLADYSEFKSHE